MAPRFGQDPPPSFSAPTLAYNLPLMEARPVPLAGDLIVAKEPAGRMAFETARLQQRLSWTMCWCRTTALISSRQNWTDAGRSRKTRNKASKIEKSLFETQRL